MMNSYNLAEAKARLSALVERAIAGEEIQISKRGRPVVRLVALEQPKIPLDLEALRELRSRTKPSTPTGVEILREMRDSRY